jgi:hypothetical protein
MGESLYKRNLKFTLLELQILNCQNQILIEIVFSFIYMLNFLLSIINNVAGLRIHKLISLRFVKLKFKIIILLIH